MDKVYEPIVISETPFPGDQVVTQNTSVSADSSTQSIAQPDNTADNTIPLKPIAQEVIGETINTNARKILADYSFTEQGAIQIGEYQPGVSGDIRISPDGIVARNIAGEQTIAINGDTGDAVFKGQLRAGTVIGGNNKSVIIEESSSGNGRIILYRGNLPSIIIGDPS